ncbi:C39 family peptidase [Gracilibacillus dipsosauri]|uniref:C39 family peptidase n=1 Tax=Gracilibacillus dipsosauri TaxID=178340 RepID=UPI0024091DC9
MLTTLFIISIFMFFFLLYFYKSYRKKIIQYMALLYILLFGTISIGTGGYLLYTADIEWVYATDYQTKLFTTHANHHLTLDTKVEHSVMLDAPMVYQLPELPRGCEVTTLSMLLQYHDIDVDKLTLASQIVKDTTNYKQENGQIFFGNPHEGFVGDMYSFENPGYGVYHQPLTELAKSYVGNLAQDLTGSDFHRVIESISQQKPVLVITNATFQPLAEEAFETWQTPEGPIKITMKEHAVLVTGYDKDFIYFNDPLKGKQKKAPKHAFISAWEQMGKQAITIDYD